jgi:hypothetical protein
MRMSARRPGLVDLVVLKPGIALAWLAAGACAHMEPSRVTTGPEPSSEQACDAAELDSVMQAQGQADVIVVLQARPDQAAEAQVAAVVDRLGADFQLLRRYATLPGFAGTATPRGVERLRAEADVKCVQVDRPGSGGASAQ